MSAFAKFFCRFGIEFDSKTALRRAAVLGMALACGGALASAQEIVTDKPVAQPGGTADIGTYTPTSVFSAGPAFHFTAAVTVTSIYFDAGPDGVQELSVRSFDGAQCAYNQEIPAGAVCGVETEIASRFPGLRSGALNIVTTGKRFRIPVSFVSYGSQVAVTPGTLVNPVAAGQSLTGSSLAVDASGNMYLTNTDGTISKVDAKTGAVTVVAGAANDPAMDGNGGPATAAHIGYPVDVAVSPAGDVYMVSSYPYLDDEIRKVDGETGVISTVAGFLTGRVRTPGNPSGAGTDGAVAVDEQGNIYTSVTKNNALVVTLADSRSTKYLIGSERGDPGCNAGTAYAPTTLAVSGGYVYFYSSAAIYKISTDTSACKTPVLVAGTGLAGNSGDGGLATKAAFGLVSGIAVDAAGDVYFADATNNAVRMVSAATGVVSSIAGAGSLLSEVTVAPSWASLALDVRGNVYVLSAAGSVQKIDVGTAALNYAQTAVGEMSSDSPRGLTLTNIGNLALPMSAPVATGDFAIDASSTCGVGNGIALQAGASCTANVDFKPTANGARTGTLSAAGSTATLSGGASAKANATTVKPGFSVQVNPGALELEQGQTATAQFTFAPAGGFTGAVNFRCEGLPAGVSCSFAQATMTADGSDKLQASQLTVSTHAMHTPQAAIGGNNRVLGLASLLSLGVMLFGWLKLRRNHARSLQGLALMLLLAVGLAGSTGCGSGIASQFTGSTRVAVKVVATSVNDGSTQTTGFMLTMK